MEAPKYVDYNDDDTTHFGAEGVIRKELEYINRRRGNQGDTKLDDLSGIALSGGGIRSASFSLGVLQALSHNGWLKKFDYLSTVSGGGYIGSSISWLLSQKLDKNETGIERFGVEKHNFPYGSYPMAGVDPKAYQNIPAAEVANPINQDVGVTENYKGKLLRYLRQQAKYLTPGDGINAMSLVAVVLRGALLSLLVYFGLLLLFFVLIERPLLSFELQGVNTAVWLSVIGGSLFFLSAVIYSLAAFWLSKKTDKQKNEGEAAKKGKGRAYRFRQRYERFTGKLLTVSLLMLVVGMIPYVDEALQYLTTDVTGVMSDFEISGSKADDGSLQISGSIKASTEQGAAPKPEGLAGFIVGALSTLLGFSSGILAFFKTGSKEKGILPMAWLVVVGTIAIWFGLLLLSYRISVYFWASNTLQTAAMIWIAGAIGVGVIGRIANINYTSIHRYYRDRLMEAFMPDVDKALDGNIATRAAAGADKMGISSLLDDNSQPGLKDNPAPYHLINTNVVLASSRIPKFRGRGGDSFILSPYYCGSNATGWTQSKAFMRDRMNLPTAMAISGAAVNPDTGVGGDGVTRQPLLSMLMGLLNIRLGYWAPNPANDRKQPKKSVSIPNYFFPGLSELLLRQNLNENNSYIELTDGGHFENLALYELIRRRTRLIIVCDAGADAEFQFSDLANAIEKVRVDFGTLILCDCEDLQPLVPRAKDKAADDDIKCAKRGYLMSRIIYPDNSEGRLIYIKTTFFEQLSADLYGYKKTHPEFPDESTGDQFFDEKQFEAYRELGFQTAWRMMQDPEICADVYVQLVS